MRAPLALTASVLMALLGTSTAVPSNADGNFTSSTDLEVQGAPPGMGDHDLGCLESPAFNLRHMRELMVRTKTWCNAGNKVKHKQVTLFAYKTALLYICNCKQLHYDPCPNGEWDYFNYKLNFHCKWGKPGWMFMSKWDKGYTRVHSSNLGKVKKLHYLCRKGCADSHRFAIFEAYDTLNTTLSLEEEESLDDLTLNFEDESLDDESVNSDRNPGLTLA
jgi:hypothetical protein